LGEGGGECGEVGGEEERDWEGVTVVWKMVVECYSCVQAAGKVLRLVRAALTKHCGSKAGWRGEGGGVAPI
jgi:hypothetical protein